jgi:hypothetical protein
VIRHEDLVRAVARFLTQIGNRQGDDLTTGEIAHELRVLALRIEFPPPQGGEGQ